MSTSGVDIGIILRPLPCKACHPLARDQLGWTSWWSTPGPQLRVFVALFALVEEAQDPLQRVARATPGEVAGLLTA